MKAQTRALCAVLLCALLCCTALSALATEPTGPVDYAAPQPSNGLDIVTRYRYFVSRYGVVHNRKVSYYDAVYAYNHTQYVQTPFDASVPAEYFVVDGMGYAAVAPGVLDIADAVRTALYDGDIGKVALLYGQYTERIRSGPKSKRWGFSGIHEGLDFIAQRGQALHAVMDGVVTRTGGDAENTLAIYNADYDVTVFYLHTAGIKVSVGEAVRMGDPISKESNRGSGSPYTHIELRGGKMMGVSPYRNTKLTSLCPYETFRKALNVLPSDRAPDTLETGLLAERERAAAEAERQAAARRALEEETARIAAEEAARLAALATPTPQPTPSPTPTPAVLDELPDELPGNFGFVTPAP
jgi:murein DD-endopeptidase MepM/ murein hydrolase activator NlpD